MDPELQQLSIQLSEAAVRNTAGAVIDRIRAVRARKKDAETIAELEEIINTLISDKSELVRIAQSFEQELVAQQLSPENVEYITTNIIPVLSELMEASAQSGNANIAEAQAMMDLVKSILSVETVTVLQLVGFNFRRAIGEPLTTLVGRLILSGVQSDQALNLEIQRLGMERELAYIQIAQDPEAYARLTRASEQG